MIGITTIITIVKGWFFGNLKMIVLVAGAGAMLMGIVKCVLDSHYRTKFAHRELETAKKAAPEAAKHKAKKEKAAKKLPEARKKVKDAKTHGEQEDAIQNQLKLELEADL